MAPFDKLDSKQLSCHLVPNKLGYPKITRPDFFNKFISFHFCPKSVKKLKSFKFTNPWMISEIWAGNNGNFYWFGRWSVLWVKKKREDLTDHLLYIEILMGITKHLFHIILPIPCYYWMKKPPYTCLNQVSFEFWGVVIHYNPKLIFSMIYNFF